MHTAGSPLLKDPVLDGCAESWIRPRSVNTILADPINQPAGPGRIAGQLVADDLGSRLPDTSVPRMRSSTPDARACHEGVARNLQHGVVEAGRGLTAAKKAFWMVFSVAHDAAQLVNELGTLGTLGTQFPVNGVLCASRLFIGKMCPVLSLLSHEH
jgi:hypothetical protein